MSRRKPILRPKDLNRLDFGVIVVGGRDVPADASTCALCGFKATSQRLTLRPDVARWLRRADLCARCQKQLAEPRIRVGDAEGVA